jgi:hypothetical protein
MTRLCLPLKIQTDNHPAFVLQIILDASHCISIVRCVFLSLCMHQPGIWPRRETCSVRSHVSATRNICTSASPFTVNEAGMTIRCLIIDVLDLSRAKPAMRARGHDIPRCDVRKFANMDTATDAALGAPQRIPHMQQVGWDRRNCDRGSRLLFCSFTLTRCRHSLLKKDTS